VITLELIYIIFLIFVFSTIQSIFGLGLLLFGTPSLLLLGYGFTETLWMLLPSSCSLSLIQIIENREKIVSKNQVYLITVPALIISLILIIQLEYLISIKKIIGTFLLLTALLRLSTLADQWLKKLIENSKSLIYLFIGVVHGVSNLGGAPLSVLASSIHKESSVISSNIAFVYFILAFSQIIVLTIFEREIFTGAYLLFIPLVISNYYLTSKILLSHIDDTKFKFLINILIVIFGIFCFF
tara:strand:- start:1378 stop:2100 length:723 start_codon:yes stop_codon:yes gene_type:complete